MPLLLFLGLLALSGPLVPQAHGAPSAAADTTRLDLPSLLAQVLEHNPSLRAARLEAEARARRPAQVEALPDPSVMVGYRPLAVAGVSGAVPSQLMVQQTIPYPGKRSLAGEAAAYAARAAEHEAEALALDLVYQLREAYYALYRIQQQDRLIQAFVDRLEGFEEAAAVRYEVGQGPQQAILKAQVERLALERQRLDLAAARRMELEHLAHLTHRPDLAARPDGLVLARPEVDPAPAAPSAANAFERRPEVAALEMRQRQADAAIALARKAYRPDLMVSAGLMDMMVMDEPVRPLENLGSRFTLQAGLVIPLQRRARAAALDEARLERRQLDARLEALQTEIQMNLNELHARLREDARSIVLYEETLLPQADLAVESTLSAYTAGRADFMDLLDAERMRFDLHMGREETLARYLQTQAALERALGTAPLLALYTTPWTPAG